MFDEFDEEGDDSVGNEYVERGTNPVDTIAAAFSSVPENNQVVEDIVENSIGDDYGHDGGVFAADEGLPRKIEHSAFVEGPFRNEGGHFRGPLFEFVAVFAAQERLLGHHDALVVDPIDERDDDEGEDIHRIDEKSGPDEVVGEVERVAHHGVDAFGIEVVGDLLGGVATGGAFRGGADGICA